ncbi:uncharacterized protein LOC126676407 [Mercurialis annua]|uniref:uncharacterized protein LOC126676407 n=1 Tax=Mercurialis annua TaxID=3986 RepID=UPI00215F6F44|nr:uncharacterized protein LOC126676407 [Mercurialis annua]
MEDPASTKFTWKIPNCCERITWTLVSDIFIVHGCKWRLRSFPRVYDLSIYLDVADSISLPCGWRRRANFSVTVISQFDKKFSVTKDTKHVFNANASNWGFISFIPLSSIKIPGTRYNVNDTLIVEARIEVCNVVHYSVIQPAKNVNEDKQKLHKRAVETSLDQAPLSCHNKKHKMSNSKAKNLPQKEVLANKGMVEPPTSIINHFSDQPFHYFLSSYYQTGIAVQQFVTTTNEQNIVMKALPPPTIVDEQDLTQDPPSEPVLSSPDVQEISKNLLTEISSRTRTQKSFPSNEIPIPSEASRPDFIRQQKEALDGFLNMSLEAIQQADAFGKMEKIILALVQHTNSLQEKTILENLASRLAEFQESVPKSTTIAETVQARKISLARKSVDLNARLEQSQKELTTLEEKFSRLSEEEAKLHAEIQRLTTQKEELLSQKQSAAIERQKANEGASRELEEWRGLEREIKQSNAERLEAKEKLALANVRWKHYKEDLAETMKNGEA